ncbi:MAG: hypothetical protein HY096_00400 [Nitrospinae bacterium]|nr:hypothetical protein [Nitrospinota bacterium]
MSKRFTDTEKYKKKFIRELPGPYKLFWDYLYHDCSFAGIWYVDFEVAQIRIGKDMVINQKEAIELFNKDEERIIILNGGSKWFIKSFTIFQYGELNSNNKLHLGVLRELEKEGVSIPLKCPFKGAKDKDKDKDKEKEKEREREGMQGEGNEREEVLGKLPEKKIASETNSDVKKFIDYAFESFQKKHGKGLCVDGKKDGMIAKKLLGTYRLESLKGLWDVFMQSNDPFIQQAGHSIGIFKTQINKLISTRGKLQGTLKTAGNWALLEQRKREREKAGVQT